jgi:L,D-transpeptidase-like protein
MLRTPYWLARGTFIALAICSAPAYSFASPSAPTVTATPASIEQRAASFSPGQFAWHPELATEGPVQIVVSVPMQTAFVFRGGTLIGATTVSTGMPGKDTPTGSFTILQKKKMHHSNIYDAAPMPFMQRLTWDGVALHAGKIPGYPASHGCVRLPAKFAPMLYEVTSLGAEVTIVDQSVYSAEDALALTSSGRPQVQLADQETALPDANELGLRPISAAR